MISFYFIRPRATYIPCYPVTKRSQHTSFGNDKDGVIQLYETVGKIIVLCVYYLYFLDNGETQDSVPNGIRYFSNLMCS